MTAQTTRVAQNTTYLTIAYIMQKVLTFGYFIVIARMVGVEDIGKYVFALSFTTIFSILIDAGISPVITREGAKRPGQLAQIVSSIIPLKAGLAVITYGLAIAVVMLMGKDVLVQQLVMLSGLIMVLDSFSLSFYAVFRAKQQLQYEAVGMIIGQVLIVATGLIALWLGASLHWLIIAILIGSTFNLVYSFILLRTKTDVRLGVAIDRPLLRRVVRIAVPFFVAGIFARLYGYMDTVLLSSLAGDTQVGWYSAGYKITFALQFLPSAFAAALFPAMADAFERQSATLAKTFETAMVYLAVIALPIAAGVWVLAPEFIYLMYGAEFLPTADALQVLIVALPFIFLAFPVGSLLNACNKQTINTVNTGITMAVNIILNLILIPLMGDKAYLGSAIAVLVSSLTLFVLGMMWVPKITPYRGWWLVTKIGRALLISAVMIGLIIILKPFVPLVGLVAVGAVVYGGGIFLSRTITWKEVVSYWRLLITRTA